MICSGIVEFGLGVRQLSDDDVLVTRRVEYMVYLGGELP